MVVFSRFSHYFEEVARRGSIRRASERSNVASSAITRQILNAEENLGVSLFERQTNGMRLTAAGELLSYHIRRWQREFEQIKGELEGLQGLHGGRIGLGVAEGIVGDFLADALAEFGKKFPRVHITIKVSRETTIDMLVSGKVDVCVTYRAVTQRALRVQHALEQPIGIIVPPIHPLVAKKTARLRDCVDHPVIMLDGDILTQSRISAALDRVGLELRPAVVVDNLGVLRLLVQRGLGIGFAPFADCISECEQGKLVFLPLRDPQVHPLCLSIVTAGHPTPTVIRFCQFLSDRFSYHFGPQKAKPSLLA
jgi:DNA-binding transcriptional LysR family regulator